MIELELLENKESREQMIDEMKRAMLEVGIISAERFNDLVTTFGESDFIECCKNYSSNNSELSYVYFVYNNTTKLTKIGVTSDLLKRSIKINSEFRNTIGIEPNMKLIAVIPCYKKSKYISEKYVHTIFKENRKFGEWFDINFDDVFYSFINPIKIINNVMIGDSFLIANIDNIYKYEKLCCFSYGDIIISETIHQHIKDLAKEMYSKIVKRDLFYYSVSNNISIKTMNEIINTKFNFIEKIPLADRININDVLSCEKYLCPKR